MKPTPSRKPFTSCQGSLRKHQSLQSPMKEKYLNDFTSQMASNHFPNSPLITTHHLQNHRLNMAKQKICITFLRIPTKHQFSFLYVCSSLIFFACAVGAAPVTTEEPMSAGNKNITCLTCLGLTESTKCKGKIGEEIPADVVTQTGEKSDLFTKHGISVSAECSQCAIQDHWDTKQKKRILRKLKCYVSRKPIGCTTEYPVGENLAIHTCRCSDPADRCNKIQDISQYGGKNDFKSLPKDPAPTKSLGCPASIPKRIQILTYFLVVANVFSK